MCRLCRAKEVLVRGSYLGHHIVRQHAAPVTRKGQFGRRAGNHRGTQSSHLRELGGRDCRERFARLLTLFVPLGPRQKGAECATEKVALPAAALQAALDVAFDHIFGGRDTVDTALLQNRRATQRRAEPLRRTMRSLDALRVR